MSLEQKALELEKLVKDSVATVINDGQAISLKVNTGDDGLHFEEFDGILHFSELFIESVYAENDSVIFVLGDME